MRLILQFGLLEPKREVSWWSTIKDFPTLVLYKNQKWEFVMYNEDPDNKVNYICFFGEVKSYDPSWHSKTYVDITHLIEAENSKCVCGAIYASFSWDHMRYCPKWTPWS